MSSFKNVVLEGSMLSCIKNLSNMIKENHPEYNLYNQEELFNLNQMKEPFLLITENSRDANTFEYMKDKMNRSYIFFVRDNRDKNNQYQLIKRTVFKENKIYKKTCECSGFDLLHFGCRCN